MRPIFLSKRTFVFVFSGMTSLTTALSSYHDNLNADTIMVYFAALIRWTPFFWAQDRYGMLVPLLTMPIQEPLYNLIVQNALHIMTSMLSFYLIANYLFPRRWLEIGTISILSYLALSGSFDIKDYLTPWQIYTPAIMFGMLGLGMAAQHFLLAFVLLTVAQWCNFSVAIFLGLLLMVKALEQIGREGWTATWPVLKESSILLFLSTIAGQIIRLSYQTQQAKGYGFQNPIEALMGWVRLVHSHVISDRSSLWILLLPLVCGIAALLRHAVKKESMDRDQTVTLRVFIGV